MARTGDAAERLEHIMRRLRADGGCPWDREQDIRTLRPYLVEETYEVLDEMDRVGAGGAWRPLCEELGDLLFQIVFHAQLAAELGEFDLADVATAIADKIESRHPHVFGDVTVSGAEEVLKNWAQLKAEERKRKHGREGSVLDGVPSAAPALLRAERLTEKASRIGFDWPDLAGVRGKLDEELDELDRALASGDAEAVEHELGDVLFSLVNLARFTRTPAEIALRAANARFTWRFHAVEEGLRADGVPFGTASLERMEALWQSAKRTEAAFPPPRAPLRAVPARIRVTTQRVADVQRFWSEVGPLLGWAVDVGATEWTLDAAGLAILFDAPGRSGEPSAALALEVDAVALPAELEARVTGCGGRWTSDGANVVVTDPGDALGVRCRVV